MKVYLLIGVVISTIVYLKEIFNNRLNIQNYLMSVLVWPVSVSISIIFAIRSYTQKELKN